MEQKPKDIKVVLAQAMEKKTAEERRLYLDAVCGTDTAMRQEIESLLGLEHVVGDFLGIPVLNDAPTMDVSTVTEGPGTVIGRYKLLEKIGEGGMAVVYMAEQQHPIRRMVAVKLIKLGMDTRQVIARFEAERQALALLDHPSIAKVLDAGATEGGRPYFVMELVRGITLTEYCDENQLSTKDRLALFVQVCHAVQHAHQKGIIHRDLKPSNVMVTMHDDRAVPKVIDFGIAKATGQKLTEKTLFTRYAQLIGTPIYMSPEQAQLSGLDIDTRSDIYSLGVLLYELLTGTTPFSEEELRKAGYLEMHRVIREQEPLRPSTKLSTLGETLTDVAQRRGCTPELLRKVVQGDLDWIVMKSLEKDRTRRYETANGLAVDIERHLNNEPVLARPPSTIYRFRKLVRRNKGVFAAATLVAAVLVLGAIVSTWQAVRATQARREQSRLHGEAVAAREVAVAAQAREAALRRQAQAQAYASDMSLAQQALAVNDLDRTLRLLEAHRPARGEVDLRGWEWRYLWQECRSDALAELRRSPRSIRSVAFSPDGKVLAVLQRPPPFIEIWDVSSHKQVATLQMERPGRFVAFSPQGDLVAADSGNRVLLWRTDTWNLAGSLDLNGSVQDLKFSPHGRLLASLSFPDEVTVWAVDHFAVLHRIRGVKPLANWLGGLTFSPDGQLLAVGDADRRLQIIDLAGGNTVLDIPEAHPDSISSVAWSPDGSIIASGSGYTLGEIRLWNAVSGTLLGTLEGHTHWVCALIFSADSAWLYSASADQTIRIWDVRQRQPLTVLRGSREEVNGLALSPDGATLASTSRDGTVAFWNAHPRPDKEQPARIPLGREARPVWPAFAPGGRVLAVPRGGIVRLFDLASMEEIEQLPALGDDIWQVVYSPDGTLLMGGGASGKIRIWSCVERRLLKELDASDAGILLFTFRADGRRLLSIDAKGRVIWWDTVVWQAVRTFVLDGTGLRLRTAAVTPDGRLLAVGSGAAVSWFNAETGELLEVTSGGHRGNVYGIALSQDGTRAGSVGSDGTLAIWDPASLQPIATFRGHMMSAAGMAFSPDGRRFATGGNTHDAVKLWDVESHRDVMTLAVQDPLLWAIAFSPDGQWLAACSEISGQLHLWHAPSWEEIEAAENSPADGGQGPTISVADYNNNDMVQRREE